ncbi:hypothetical protein P7K49_018354 [Saguinus oedipus]|uniref:Uncharacterized protein n=1 Tax=Saguinus oedipus TaxID=9490 RepID=A0ABQ9V757_SAGOE|nr:hypothetical protein P7K49_018354 [Saguinus oedipus]
MKKATKKPAEVQTSPPKLGTAKKAFPSKAVGLGTPRQSWGRLGRLLHKAKAIRKSKAKGSRSSVGDAEAHRKTKAGSKSSKPTANKVKDGAASPTRKVVAKAEALKQAAAQGAEQRPNSKAASPARGSGFKVVPAHLTRKTEAPKGLKKPGLSIKTSSSKVFNQRAEA